MKLIITGASGYVAQEIIRQSLHVPEITSVIAVSRRPVAPPSGLGVGADAAKLRSVTVPDYDQYPDNVKKEFANADACIWTAAVTFTKSYMYSDDELRRINHIGPLTGLKTMYEAGPAKPFRFMYMSASAGERDQTKTPAKNPRLLLLIGETENKVLAMAKEHQGEVEACVAKSGFIMPVGRTKWIYPFRWAWFNILALGLHLTGAYQDVPMLPITEMVAAMLHQVVHGFEKEPLFSDDLQRIGAAALASESWKTYRAS